LIQIDLFHTLSYTLATGLNLLVSQVNA